MLRLDGVDAGYGPVQVLRGVSVEARAGEVTCIMGRNGAGKSTLLKCVMGLVPASAGKIVLDGAEVQALPPHRVPRHGVAFVPQGRRLFGPMTVAENLEVGLLTRHRGSYVRDRVLDLFPRLAERLGQVSSTLSGGEQQMLAIGRALCIEPKVLLLDEPTEGLQPSMIALIRDVLVRLKGMGVAVVLVEQRIDAVLRVADRVAFMERGELVAAELRWPVDERGLATLVALGVAGHKFREQRPLALGTACGVIYCFVALLSKAVVDIFTHEGLSVLVGSWQFYGLIGLALTGTVVQQYSFNAGPLAHSLPAMTIFEPIVAFGLGYMVLGEKFLIDTAVGWAIMLIALTVMVLSTIVLSRSPVSQRG